MCCYCSGKKKKKKKKRGNMLHEIKGKTKIFYELDIQGAYLTPNG